MEKINLTKNFLDYADYELQDETFVIKGTIESDYEDEEDKEIVIMVDNLSVEYDELDDEYTLVANNIKITAECNGVACELEDSSMVEIEIANLINKLNIVIDNDKAQNFEF